MNPHFREKVVVVSPPSCLRTHSKVAFCQSSTALGPSLYRSGTKRCENNFTVNPVWYKISGPKWAHQKNHRSRHSKFCSWNCWHQRFHDLHHLPSRWGPPSVFCKPGLGGPWPGSSAILIISDPKKTLGIKLPYLVMIIKNMKKYFTFEVQVRLWMGKQFSPWKPTTKFSGAGRQKCAKEIPGIKLPVNYQVQIHIKVLCEFSSTGWSPLFAQCPWDSMMAGIKSRWPTTLWFLNLQPINTVHIRKWKINIPSQFNLADFTRRAYGTNYVETLRVRLVLYCLQTWFPPDFRQ